MSGLLVYFSLMRQLDRTKGSINIFHVYIYRYLRYIIHFPSRKIVFFHKIHISIFHYQINSSTCDRFGFYGIFIASNCYWTGLAFHEAVQWSHSRAMVDPIALHKQLRNEYQSWLERAKARDGRDLVFGLRHANVLAQSFIHLPAVEVEEGRTSLGCRKPRCFPRSINNSIHHNSGLDTNNVST